MSPCILLLLVGFWISSHFSATTVASFVLRCHLNFPNNSLHTYTHIHKHTQLSYPWLSKGTSCLHKQKNPHHLQGRERLIPSIILFLPPSHTHYCLFIVPPSLSQSLYLLIMSFFVSFSSYLNSPTLSFTQSQCQTDTHARSPTKAFLSSSYQLIDQ